MNEVMDFEETESLNEDIFDCEYTYTDSKKLKDVVLDPKRKYPFRAVIKVVRYGTMYGFKFFPPNTPITQEDRDNFEYYKRNKYKKNR